MGPLYIKAGQVLGTQSGVFSEKVTDEFRAFFSDLPPMSDSALSAVLRRPSNASVIRRLAAFDRAPIAVGSVAQVHRAVLADGTAVAVKLVKSGVRERLEASTWLVDKLLRVASTIVPAARGYDLPEHFAEMAPLLTGQCDMRAEAGRQRAVAANFDSHPFLDIPAVHDHLCTEDVLVMDFVEGMRGQDATDPDHSYPVLAARLQDVFYCMVYFHGLFHVDPHPGNMLIGSDDRITLLDFGLVGELSEEDKWNLSSFYYACVRGDWDLGVERFTRAFVVAPERLAPDRKRYQEELRGVLREHFEVRTGRWSTMSFLDDATRLLRRYGARISTRFSLLSLSLLTGEGFLSQLDADIDIWRNARRFTDRFSPYLSDELEQRFAREIGDLSPGSMSRSREAGRYLVAPTHLDRFMLPSRFPLIIAHAEGSRIRDVDGNTYIDLSCGYGPHILGYGHPVAVEAITKAAAAGGVNALGSPAELLLAERIGAAFAPGSKVVLGNSGTEAVQMAVRIARAHTGRQRVAKFEGHYHGFSDQGMVSSWFRYRGDPLRPEPVANSAGAQRSVVDATLVLPYGEVSSLELITANAGDLACVLVEPMPAALADFDAPFLAALRDVCARAGVLVVYDEVVTGFRVHYGGAQHLALVEPDLTCLGKIIGGGLPCGAVVGRAEVVDVAKTTGDPFLDVDSRAFVGGTMSGNSITASAGAAVLGHLQAHPGLYDDLRRGTKWLTEQLAGHAHGLGVPLVVKGRHSIFSVVFDYAMPRSVRNRLTGSNIKANIGLSYYMRRYGVYLPELHTMMLSTAHTDADLERVAEAFGASLRDMAEDGFFAI